MIWVGYREGVAHTKNEKSQKRTKLTAIPLLRAVAPASPMLLSLNQSFWSVLFSYTGRWHDMGGLPGRGGVAHTKCKGMQKTSNITLSVSARDTAPSGPMWLPLKSRIWSDLFPYTGTRHNEGGLPGEGSPPRKEQDTSKQTSSIFARAFAPSSPILTPENGFPARLSTFNVLFTYTGTNKNKDGLPGRG